MCTFLWVGRWWCDCCLVLGFDWVCVVLVRGRSATWRDYHTAISRVSAKHSTLAHFATFAQCLCRSEYLVWAHAIEAVHLRFHWWQMKLITLWSQEGARIFSFWFQACRTTYWSLISCVFLEPGQCCWLVIFRLELEHLLDVATAPFSGLTWLSCLRVWLCFLRFLSYERFSLLYFGCLLICKTSTHWAEVGRVCLHSKLVRDESFMEHLNFKLFIN